ncbi:MFS general substrate transporter [Punctularia strigosozonata HHB-11173 SS5]|uniref:MFS general substrate transporter n=1 Tax=Punctularia strigosozonata (strain HHB-11173) TaxID=741275 RepID=UPI00044172C3|nr:MFS general substrate transporter [Punctularia strigosozonata HHB-11173 SS5]EIN11465.1 MFS general substrate transporter [Punctularia strigosozonata HHB-11173 SS5]
MVAADDREAVDKDDLEGTSANEPELATVPPVGTNALVGVAKVEAVQAVYGKYGKYCLWAGLAMMMIVFELDNSTVYTYQNYATSAFDQLALLSTLSTAQTIVTAVVKPPIAKISDVLGRGETYLFTISCYLISYALCASAPTISAYAAGAIFYSIGQSGTQILDQIIISDISTARWRGLVLGLSYFPFLITPWVAAFIVDSVTRQGGIGWRWGIGMFAIIMPFASSFIIITLLYLQRKARKSGLVLTTRLTVYDFCSLIDLGGLFLLCSGAAMFLLPLTLAAQTPSAWRTPWVGTVIALGVLSLAALVPYEKYVARHPVVPVRYGRNRSIVMSCVLAAVDTAGFSATHVYLYSWSVVAHNYSARNATFLVYTNGVTQCLTGIVAGALMYRYRRYKPLAVAGALVRLVGYALMLRLRGTTNPASELFLVQLVQGVGSGFVQQVAVVAGQVAVPHEELAGVSALVLLSTFMGSAVGSCIAGGIYTGVFKDALRRRLGKVPGAEVDEATVERLISSITGTALPAWGSAERVALDFAVSGAVSSYGDYAHNAARHSSQT